MTPTDELLRAHREIRDALLAADRDALDALLADEYRGYDPSGRRVTRKETLKAYSPGGIDLESYVVEELEARVGGELGFVSGKGSLAGRQGDSEFAHELRFLDVWILHEENWRLFVSHVTELGR